MLVEFLELLSVQKCLSDTVQIILSFPLLKNTFRDLPFMPQERLLHLGTGIGYPGWNKKIFATKQLIQWMNSITVLIN